MSGLMERYRVTTDPLRTERRVELVALVCLLLLVLQLIWGVIRSLLPLEPAPVLPTAESMQVAAITGGGVLDPGMRGEIVQRPLFWASREPLDAERVKKVDKAAEAAKKDKASKKPETLKGVKLVGVFGVGDDAGIIVLSKGKKHRLTIGEELDGWTLKSVDPDKAGLTAGARTAQLELQRGKHTASQEITAEPGSSAIEAEPAATSVPVAPPPRGLGLGGGDRGRGTKTNK